PDPAPDPYDPQYAASFDEAQDPRVSTSAGEAGGVVVLWPRVVPGQDAESFASEAELVQSRLVELSSGAFEGRPMDVRPSPQRVCPQDGCAGPSIGAMVLHQSRGCAVVALLGRPGDSEVRLVPWAGQVELKQSVVPFREPPESHVTVKEMVPCESLPVALADGLEAAKQAFADFAAL